MKSLSIVIISLGILLTGCYYYDNDRRVIGSGDVVSEEITVPAFTGVSVEGKCDVNIVIGEPQSVTLSAQQNVLDVMTYEVDHGVLEIGFERNTTVNTDEEISADIVVPSLSSIGITGAGNFDLSGEKQSSLDIYITGAGNVEAFDMNVDDCTIMISGTGNCSVWVNNSLDVNVSGVGHVYYRGDPEISSTISGVGSVHNSN